jgi:LysM repeat protein
MIKLLIIASISFFSTQPRQDSVRTEIINGKKFIIHQVEAGETLYGISRRYGVTLDQLVDVNPDAGSGLEVGRMLKVPYVPRTTPKPVDGIIHRVAEKETLYSISKLYGVTIDEVKQWNNLSGDGLSLGQELVIKKRATPPVLNQASSQMKSVRTMHTVEPKETLYSISRKYGITTEQLKEWNGLQSEELKIGQALFISQPIYTKPQSIESVVVKPEPPVLKEGEKKPVETQVIATPTERLPTITITESIRKDDEIVQSGLAELIEGTEGNRKHLALHRTAPVGTILKIRNEMNNREVFVRVMGKLPDTGLNEKVLIKISKSAYDRLGAIDPRFRVEITYSQ